MKTTKSLLLVLFLAFFSLNLKSQDELFAYYKVETTGTVSEIKVKLLEELKTEGFTFLGSYSPMGKSATVVIAFTRNDLTTITFAGATQRALASVLKIAINKKSETLVEVSLLNPEYIFYAYMGNNTTKYVELKLISDDAIKVLKKMGTKFSGFGGKLSKSELKKYHYMLGMPYFTDIVELSSFTNFETACTIIENNLASKKGNTQKIYSRKLTGSKIAIFGIALNDKKDGESFFLPIIGPDHIAAMPYEIIVIDKKAYMLPGKYRFALHWPELSMSQFMKIVNTPGYVEDTFKKLTVK